jgi:hypothetical protein
VENTEKSSKIRLLKFTFLSGGNVRATQDLFCGCKGKRGQLIQAKETYLICVITRMFPSGDDIRSINDENMGSAGMFLTRKNIHQTSDAHLQPGFFYTFPLCCPSRIFACIHKARWQGPKATLRVICPPHKQHLMISFHQDSYSNLGISKIDPAAVRANTPDCAKAHGIDHGCPTAGAEIYFVR